MASELEHFLQPAVAGRGAAQCLHPRRPRLPRLVWARAGDTPRIVAAEQQLERLLAMARLDESVLAILLFGSRARGDGRADSDVDVCLVLAQAERERLDPARTRLRYAMQVDLDVQVFQQLPIYVRQRVLKEGQVLFVRDEAALYDLALRTVRAFALFRPRFEAYLAEVERARS